MISTILYHCRKGVISPKPVHFCRLPWLWCGLFSTPMLVPWVPQCAPAWCVSWLKQMLTLEDSSKTGKLMRQDYMWILRDRNQAIVFKEFPRALEESAIYWLDFRIFATKWTSAVDAF